MSFATCWRQLRRVSVGRRRCSPAGEGDVAQLAESTELTTWLLLEPLAWRVRWSSTSCLTAHTTVSGVGRSNAHRFDRFWLIGALLSIPVCGPRWLL